MSDYANKISQFIPYYPPQGEKNFSYEIARRKEYNMLKLSPEEKIPDTPGTPLASQELQARFFSPHTDFTEGLMYHGFGTGKSCLSSLIVENFKATIVDDQPRKQALVLVPNEDLKINYINDVAYQCTQFIYSAQNTPEELKRMQKLGITPNMTKRTVKGRVKKAVSKTYEIKTYGELLRSDHSDRYIIDHYSNRIIIIDEAHHFRIQPKSTAAKSKDEKGTSTDVKITKDMYDKMHHFLHTVQRCRKILLTGTPIWDQVYEIASLMNLILPMEEQLPTKNTFIKKFFDNEGNLIHDDLLRERFQGRISFLRTLMTTAKREEIGVSKPWLNYVKIYPSAMSEFQYRYAKEAIEKTEIVKTKRRTKEGKITLTEREVKGGAVRRKAREAAAFVFPIFEKRGGKWRVVGGDYASEAFRKNIKLQGARYIYKDPPGAPMGLLAKEISTNLEKYSSIFAAVFQEIKNHPNELVFIYNEFVKEGGGGAINMGLIAQQLGFIRARTSHDIATPDPQGAKRFAIITSNETTTHQPKQIEELIESVGRADNMYGQRCQIIIGSQKIAEGLTLKNFRQVHIVRPHWNIPATEQALGRVFRVGSHSALPAKERYIKIYRHASVKKGKEDVGVGYPTNKGFSSEETMDIIVYRTAENKEHLNTQVYRAMKESSWDCPLTYQRNVLEGDEDGSRVCDYQDCNYRCDGFPKKYIDRDGVWSYNIPENDILRDTYNLFYTSNDIQKMIEQIIKLFGVYFSLSLNMIVQLLDIEELEKTLLLRAVDYIINARIRIKDRYGFGAYLKEKGNMYFLDKDVSVVSNYPNTLYVSNPFVTERSSLEDLAETDQLRKDKQLIEQFSADPRQNMNVLEKMYYRTLIVLLEKSQEIKYGASITLKQKEAIEVLEHKLGQNLYDLGNGIIVHNMYANEYTGVGYSTSKELTSEGLMRVFDPETTGWRYVDDEEEQKFYISLIKKEKKKQSIAPWTENPYGIYGLVDKTGKFKIRTKPEPGKRVGAGIVCSSKKIGELIDIMGTYNILPEEVSSFGGWPRDKLINEISAQPVLSAFKSSLEDRSDEELQKILSIYRLDKRGLCQLLEDWFKSKGLWYDQS